MTDNTDFVIMWFTTCEEGEYGVKVRVKIDASEHAQFMNM